MCVDVQLELGDDRQRLLLPQLVSTRVILMGSVLLFVRGAIGRALLVSVQIGNAALLLLLNGVAERLLGERLWQPPSEPPTTFRGAK